MISMVTNIFWKEVKRVRKGEQARSNMVDDVNGQITPGVRGWIISVGGYADNSFAALGSSDRREVRLEL